MPVPSNPTLRDLWVEYGGSGTLREYVRGGALVPIGSSAGISTNASELTLRQFAGTTKPPSFLDQQTITVGLFTTKGGAFYGYFPSAATGSISDGTFNVKGGASIVNFFWSTSTQELFFTLNGSYTNDGWTNLETVSSQGTNLNFTRTSATYTNSGSNTTWKWTTNFNPFPYQSSPLLTTVCTFT